jgi:tetratricopeptide (TPR) repeat protein/AraC-like DNA-binding protein
MSNLIPKDQVFINKLTEIIVANFRNENFGIKELAKESGISRYTLSRRLHSISNRTVNQFIREERLKKALDILKYEQLSATEVAYKVGFSSPAYFNKCFHDFYGFPPGKIKTGEAEIPDGNTLAPETPVKKTVTARRTVIFTVSGILMVAILTLFVFSIFYSKIFRRSNLEKILSSGERITVVVMPFRHLTSDTINFGKIIQTSLNSFLSGYHKELRVLQEESINGILESFGLTNYASITPSMAISAARKLEADIFISGDIVKSGNTRRFYTNITDSKSKEVIKSFQIGGSSKEENLMQILDSINFQVGNYLQLSKLQKRNIEFARVTTTTSPQAYIFYLNGKDAYYRMDSNDAIIWFKKALEADTNFTWAMRFLGPAYRNNGDPSEARIWTQKFYSKKDMMNEYQKLYADYDYSNTFLTPNESIKVLKRLMEIDDQPPVHRSLGAKYFNLQQYDKAIPELERALEIYKKWGSKPLGYDFYSFLGVSYHETGQYKKEKKLYRKSERDFPDNIYLKGRQAILALTEKDTVTASRYIEKYISILKGNSVSEANITRYVGSIYREAGFQDKAEEYFRKAIHIEPANVNLQNNLASFLINTGRNINEGLDIIEKILTDDPANIMALRSKGWGLYKQGKYREALQILQESWNTKLYGYDHSALLQLEEVRKAVEAQDIR